MSRDIKALVTFVITIVAVWVSNIVYKIGKLIDSIWNANKNCFKLKICYKVQVLKHKTII